MANITNENISKANGAAHDFKKLAQGAEDSFEKMAHNAGERIGAVASDLSNSAAETVRTGREYIRDNPAKGVAIAAATGVVVGSLLTMALRRRHSN